MSKEKKIVFLIYVYRYVYKSTYLPIYVRQYTYKIVYTDTYIRRYIYIVYVYIIHIFIDSVVENAFESVTTIIRMANHKTNSSNGNCHYTRRKSQRGGSDFSLSSDAFTSLESSMISLIDIKR